MSKTRVYIVNDGNLDGPRLVRADSISTVRRWVLSQYEIRQATTDELIEALQDNENLEDATDHKAAEAGDEAGEKEAA